MDVLIDVGGEYDPEQLRYDHHQRGFSEVFGHGFSTKLSSAGLVYKHHGKEIVAGAPPSPPDHPARVPLQRPLPGPHAPTRTLGLLSTSPLLRSPDMPSSRCLARL